MEYLPCLFRFVVAATILCILFSDVYKYNRHHKLTGVLKHKNEDHLQYSSPEFYGDYTLRNGKENVFGDNVKVFKLKTK